MKLTLSIPVKPYKVSQPFGVHGDYYKAHGINVIGHNGNDLVAYHGQPVYAAHDGTAYITTDDGKEGEGIVIVTDRPYEYEGKEVFFKTVYWHLCNPIKEPRYAFPIVNGSRVRRGQLIGYADNTGLSTGDHLHFGLKPVAHGETPGSWWNLKQDNGYGGAIDPTPLMETTVIMTLIDLLKQLLKLQ